MTNMKKVLIGIASMLPAVIASAQTTAPPLPPPPATNIGGLIAILCNVLGWAFVILILLAVVFVIVAAFRYLTAAGDPEKVKKANYTLLYAAISVAVALLAKAVPLIVTSIVGSSVGAVC